MGLPWEGLKVAGVDLRGLLEVMLPIWMALGPASRQPSTTLRSAPASV